LYDWEGVVWFFAGFSEVSRRWHDANMISRLR
jgi:hypothetical protein